MSLPGLQAFIDDGYDEGSSAFAALLNARNHLYDLGNQIAGQNWAAAESACDACADDFGYLGRYLLQNDIWNTGLRGHWRDALNLINDNWPSNGEPDPYELTMDKILDVIWESDKLRWFHFINYIDSMRAGIWNTEIYEKHLEDWYRHFSTT